MAWIPSDFPRPQSSYRSPAPAFTSPPDWTDCVCWNFPKAWLPYVLGSLSQLWHPAHYTGTAGDVSNMQDWATDLIESLGAQHECTPFPTPPPNPPDGYDWDCAIAGYIVNEVVREAMQFAINKSLGLGGPVGVLYYALDLLPFSNVWVPQVAKGIEGLIFTIGLNQIFNWAEAQASDALWNLVGCTVYSAVKTVHGFTHETTLAIHDALNAIGGVNAPFLSAIANFILGLEAVALNDIARVAAEANYSCTGCEGGTGGPTTTDPPLREQAGLKVKRGSQTIYNVRELEFESGTLTGNSDDAQYTPPAPTPQLDIHVNGVDRGTPGELDIVDGKNSRWTVLGANGTLSLAVDVPDVQNVLTAIADTGSLVTAWVSDTGVRAQVFPLGNGPPGWTARGYDASGWAAARVATQNSGLSGTSCIAPASGDGASVTTGFILAFDVPANALPVVSARLFFAMDADAPCGIYFNGEYLDDGHNENWNLTTHQPNLPARYLDIPGGKFYATDNRLCIQGTNDPADTESELTFKLCLYTFPAGPTGPTGPTGPAGASGVGSVVAIQEVVVANSITSTVYFTDIPQTYRHLRIVGQAADLSTGAHHLLEMRFNGDANAHYHTGMWYGYGASGGSETATSSTAINVGYMSSAGNGANSGGVFDIRIPCYAQTDFYKGSISQFGVTVAATGEHLEGVGSGSWADSGAITAIALISGGTYFAPGSTFTLYGEHAPS